MKGTDFMRTATVERNTRETQIKISIALDGKGENKISTGIGFFDHMLTALSAHSGISMNIDVKGDLYVDGHHTVEDTGIALGQAFAKALGNKSGIERYGTAYIPMDESLAFASLDISNRPFLVCNVDYTNERIGEFDTCLTEEFFRAFAMNALITLHINKIYGKNTHHIIEAIFKSAGRSLAQSVEINGDEILSTKGVL